MHTPKLNTQANAGMMPALTLPYSVEEPGGLLPERHANPIKLPITLNTGMQSLFSASLSKVLLPGFIIRTQPSVQTMAGRTGKRKQNRFEPTLIHL